MSNPEIEAETRHLLKQEGSKRNIALAGAGLDFGPAPGLSASTPDGFARELAPQSIP
jgi:hypothetical protein